jgi:hypothetical protein
MIKTRKDFSSNEEWEKYKLFDSEFNKNERENGVFAFQFVSILLVLISIPFIFPLIFTVPLAFIIFADGEELKK